MSRRGHVVRSPSATRSFTAWRTTSRIAEVDHPTATFTAIDLPDRITDNLPATVTFDVRHFDDDYENESFNYRTQTVTVEAGGTGTPQILGTGAILEVQKRDNGGALFRCRYNASSTGVNPDDLTIATTAGPSSPADASTSFVAGQRIFEIEVSGLTDAGLYTFELRAETATLSKTLATVQFTADATGPPAPTGLTAVER